MPTGLTDSNVYEFCVRADCGVNGTFLDSGGASGNYFNDEIITHTISPNSPGGAVRINFTAFSIENDGAHVTMD